MTKQRMCSVCVYVFVIFSSTTSKKQNNFFFLCLWGDVRVNNLWLHVFCVVVVFVGLCTLYNDTYTRTKSKTNRIWKREDYYGQPDDDRLWVISSIFPFSVWHASGEKALTLVFWPVFGCVYVCLMVKFPAVSFIINISESLFIWHYVAKGHFPAYVSR